MKKKGTLAIDFILSQFAWN